MPDGREHLCSDLCAYGVHMNGGFAEAMVASAQVVYRLPSGMNPRLACLAEPLSCCVHGMDRAAIQSGSTVLVIGAGLIGLMLTPAGAAGRSGLDCFERAAGNSAGRAPWNLAPTMRSDPNPRANATPLDATHGEGFDFVIDAVGSSATFTQAVAMAARGGTVLVFGCAPMQATSTVRPFDIYARELTVKGSFINPYTHERAVSLLPQMGLEKLPIDAFPLAEFRQAFEAPAATGTAAKVELLPQM